MGKDKELDAFLEDALGAIYAMEPRALVIAVVTKPGEIVVSHFRASINDRALVAHHVQADAIMDTWELYKEMKEEEENDSDQDIDEL